MDMNKFDDFNNELINAGFKIDGDNYVLDKVTYQTTIINGQQFQQPQHMILAMKYFGEGCEVGDSDSDIEDTEFYEFGIMDGDKVVVTICVHDFNELKQYIDV